ncbi:hypothetical protein PAXRUDRAFT_434837 [Paxillus rubicundulus Ve08.2h10]|uniref:Uncharacterized protein n=1 Tax=Paxillus rubicundulus Ve08.2h10 TaxID=930991 RepID=A0A0D0DX90_9AGAM|nr:hypothetical protein PAXRUDRAFT_434837 [Paxillus rubicundulus Ve08.2h10]
MTGKIQRLVSKAKSLDHVSRIFTILYRPFSLRSVPSAPQISPQSRGRYANDHVALGLGTCTRRRS